MSRATFLRPLALCVGILTAISLFAVEPKKEPEPTFTPKQLEFFDQEVLPILKEHCYKCHGNDKTKGNFSLMTRALILEGGDLGSAISKEKIDQSNLIKAVQHRDGLEMPPSGKIPAPQIDTLVKWVKEGLPMPLVKVEPKKEHPKGGVVTEEAKRFWAYQAVGTPAIPAVKNPAWLANPIDAFVLSKLEQNGLTPAAPADKIALIRRAYYDLIGLPPTPEEVDAFVNDASTKAYEKLIDKLLAMPQYGEKWGRHWLDVVRYAETNGYERDGPKPYAWRFRDYVIKSFNEDKPYTQFIHEQLAGDEMKGENPDAIIATGFYRLGVWDDEPADPKQARYDELDDWVATTSQVFFAMTMNCARCHDHKIDPIPQADYYRLLAFFQDVPRFSDNRDPRSASNLTDISPPEIRKTYEKELKALEIQRAELLAQMTKIEDEAIKKMPAEDQRASEGLDRPLVVKKVPQFLQDEQKQVYNRLKKEVEAINKVPEPKRVMALSVNNCLVRPPQSFVMIRGNPHSPGAKVEPGFPAILGATDPKLTPPERGAKTSGRRTRLAEWIASDQNQLTARVMVNRVWQYHFGRGIVPSSSDFGKFGESPTHPELLDHLARDFMANGWTVKRLHKLIMLSNTYRMSSKASEAGLKQDPANKLFWRFNMRRLTAEEVRDSILMVSGKLNLKPGGPSVYPKIPKEVLAGQSVPGSGWGNSPPDEASRRSVYVYMKRSLLVPILSTHDQADTDSSCPVRYTTTVPTQALGMLNGEFTNEQAVALVERLKKEVGMEVEAIVKRGIRLTTGREPNEDEVKKDVEFIRELISKHQLSEALALKQYGLLLLNTNEFVYLD